MINLYTEKEIKTLEAGGKILAKVFEELIDIVKEGVLGIFLDRRARELIHAYGAEPSFLNYNNFPAALCVSINNELVHGVPVDKKFKKGDLIGLDLGVKYRGFCTDKATTILLGKDIKKKEFLRVVKKSLDKGIEQAIPGNRLGAISSTIQEVIENGGYHVVRALSGHGVGRKVHEEPRVFNFGKSTEGILLKPGMVLAIEPMACLGTFEIKTKRDNVTIASADGSLSCHFEETIVITQNGPKVLT